MSDYMGAQKQCVLGRDVSTCMHEHGEGRGVCEYMDRYDQCVGVGGREGEERKRGKERGR